MPTNPASALLLLLLFILLDLTRRHILKYINHASLLITGHGKPGILLYSLTFLPGVIIHELSHLIFAQLLRVQTGKIEIFPTFEPGSTEVKLGYVQIAKTDFLRRSIIGAAPTIVGISLIFIIAEINFAQIISYQAGLELYYQNLISTLSSLTYASYAYLYLIFTIASTMFTSRQDRDAWPILGIFLIIISIILSLSGQLSNTSELFIRFLSLIFNTTGTSLILALTINLFALILLYSLNLLLSIITGKKIIAKMQ